MKIIANRQQLLTAFNIVSGVAPSRSPKPILLNIKLTADPAGTTLMATDLEVGIRYQVQGVKVDQPGSCILPTAQIGPILRTAPDDQLAIELDGPHLMVLGFSSEFTLPTEDPNLFPEVPDFTATHYHVVQAADLSRLIRRTSYATDPDSNRYAMGGCLVELGDDTIAMVGTDGRRLARQEEPVTTAGDQPSEVSRPPGATAARAPIVPLKALKIMDRHVSDVTTPVHLAFNESAVLIRTDSAVIYSRLVEGRFPRYQDVFPDCPTLKVPLVAGPFRRAIEQASIMTSAESRAVEFGFAAGLLKLASQAIDVGRSSVKLAIGDIERPVTILLDPQYLIDALKTLPDEETVTVELIDGKHAMVMRAGDGYAHVIMPMSHEK